ncbi:MAG: hypothetical protein ACI8RD_001344, partial [Bacillariaceae sp.]
HVAQAHDNFFNTNTSAHTACYYRGAGQKKTSRI